MTLSKEDQWLQECMEKTNPDFSFVLNKTFQGEIPERFSFVTNEYRFGKHSIQICYESKPVKETNPKLQQDTIYTGYDIVTEDMIVVAYEHKDGNMELMELTPFDIFLVLCNTYGRAELSKMSRSMSLPKAIHEMVREACDESEKFRKVQLT